MIDFELKRVAEYPKSILPKDPKGRQFLEKIRKK